MRVYQKYFFQPVLRLGLKEQGIYSRYKLFHLNSQMVNFPANIACLLTSETGVSNSPHSDMSSEACYLTNVVKSVKYRKDK